MVTKNYYLLCLIIGISSSVLFSQSSADFWTVGISTGLNSPIGSFSKGDLSAGFRPSNNIIQYAPFPLKFEKDGFAQAGFFAEMNIQSKSVKGFSIGIDAGYSYNGHSSKWDNYTSFYQEWVTSSFDVVGDTHYTSHSLDPYQLYYTSLKLNKTLLLNRYTVLIGPGLGFSYLLYPYYERRNYGTEIGLSPPITTKESPRTLVTNAFQPGIRNARSILYTGNIQINRLIKEGLFIGLDVQYRIAPNLDFITGQLFKYEDQNGEIRTGCLYCHIPDRIPYEVLQIGVNVKYALGG